jgi:hypothetical protein
MYLHKTTAGMVNGKAAPEPSAKNVSTAKAAVSASVPAAEVKTVAVPRPSASLIAAAGLPDDKLSASIISFARFFSLPVKPEIMAAIRRQAFAPLPPAQADAASVQADAVPRTAAEKESAPQTTAKNREALSLAAAAAESKGVELESDGLEVFAEAVDPDWQRRREGGGRQRGRRGKNQNEQEEERSPSKTGPITAAALKEMALESAGRNPLLAIMNRLPGKNGQHWTVLPFGFSENGRDFKVSLRILLEAPSSERAVCMALDIVESGGQEDGRSRLFVLEAANDSVVRLSVYARPELPPRAHGMFVRELSRLLNIPPERISVRSRTESFPCELGSADQLRAIDEAV